MKSIILLSGGLDSALVGMIAKKESSELHAISFDYNQRHKIELQCAKKIAKFLNVKNHLIVPIPSLGQIGGSALTDASINVQTAEKKEDLPPNIPLTFVPARNTIFLSFAIAYAEVHKILRVYAGPHKDDHGGYPDCRPEFISSFETMANLSMRMTTENNLKIKLIAPLLYMHKPDIVKLAAKMGLDFSITHSCYSPIDNKACGKCLTCFSRLDAFSKANIKDPIPYA